MQPRKASSVLLARVTGTRVMQSSSGAGVGDEDRGAGTESWLKRPETIGRRSVGAILRGHPRIVATVPARDAEERT
jgi:hypothetical protein